MELKEQILAAWNNRELLKENKWADAVRQVIEEADKGRLRVASPSEKGWTVNEWVKAGHTSCTLVFSKCKPGI